MEHVFTLIINNGAEVFGTLFLALMSWLVKLYINKTKATETEKQALDALLEGMAKAQEEFVRQAKAAAEDGKLTADEIDQAKTLAIEHAKAIAIGPAKDYLIAASKERLSSLIKQLLAKVKK